MKRKEYPMIKVKYLGEIAHNHLSLLDALEKLEARFWNAKSAKHRMSIQEEMWRIESILDRLGE